MRCCDSAQQEMLCAETDKLAICINKCGQFAHASLVATIYSNFGICFELRYKYTASTQYCSFASAQSTGATVNLLPNMVTQQTCAQKSFVKDLLCTLAYVKQCRMMWLSYLCCQSIHLSVKAACLLVPLGNLTPNSPCGRAEGFRAERKSNSLACCPYGAV